MNLKVYYESRKKSVFFGIVIFTIVFSIFFHQIYGKEGFWYTIVGWSVTALILILIAAIYPKGRLELFDDHFVYTRGRVIVSSPWTTVKFVAFQRSASRFGLLSVSPSTSFFFDTDNGVTNLIDTAILKLESGEKFEKSKLVEEIEKLTGKSMVLGDVSTRQYIFWPH